jgi:catalase
MPLLEKAGVADSIDEGFVAVEAGKDFGSFIELCRSLRFWERVGAER